MLEFCQPLRAKKLTAHIPASKARLYTAFYVIVNPIGNNVMRIVRWHGRQLAYALSV
jgi:hypothetical protein